MGKKNRSKKFERQEKSKVKLKKKQPLPKGQNITDTTFKVKKIVLREQLKVSKSNEPVSKRKLNVQELLTRLQHYNTTMRKDALEGLNELVTVYSDEILDGVHLPRLIENVTRLSLDTESSVRSDALKLIASILKKVTEVQIAPLLDILLSYLCCAMTHLSQSIQEDSLLLLDALLDACPSLVANRSHTVLPRFFDMISRLRSDSKPGRLLVMNLGSRLTSVRWRIQVLSRMHMMIKALFNSFLVEKHEKPKTLIFSDQHFYPVFNKMNNNVCFLPSILQKDVSNSDTITDEKNKLQGYVDSLMPLLFETWMEAAPQDSGDDEKSLNEENAALLQCIVGVMVYLWKYLVAWEVKYGECNTVTEWYRQRYVDGLKQHFLSDFPYIMNSLPTTDKRQHREHKRNMEMLKRSGVSSSLDASCAQQNTALCYLACCLVTPSDHSVTKTVQSYIKSCLISDSIKYSEILPPLEQLLLGSASEWENSEDILDVAVAVVNERPQLVNLLCDVLMKQTLSYWQRCASFQTWIAELPTKLCGDSFNIKIVQALQQLICQKNLIALERLRIHLPQIIDKLPTIDFCGSEDVNEAKRSVANLIFWVRNLDPPVKTLVEEQLQNGRWDEELSQHVSQIIELQSHF